MPFYFNLKGHKMNCIIHNDTQAVGTCGQCGGGLCGVCIQNSVQMEDGRLYCKGCAFQAISLYIANLKDSLDAALGKKIIWTAILAIGAWVIVSNYLSYKETQAAEDAVWVVVGFLIWSLGGVTERFVGKSVQEQITDGMVARDALRGEGYVWIVWAFNIAFWIAKNALRGLIFPIFYARFMIWGSKDIKAKIAHQQAILDELAAKSA